MLFYNIQIIAKILLGFLLAILILKTDFYKKLNRKFAFLAINISFFGIAIYLTRNAESPERAIFWASFFPLGIRLIAPAFLDFCLELVKLDTRGWRIAKYSGYISGIIFYFLSHSKFFYKGATYYSFGYYTQGGILHILWYWSLLLFASLGCYVIIKSHFKADNFLKHKTKYFIFGGVMFLIFACFNTLPMYGFNIYPLGILGEILAIVIGAYAAFENKLIDINILVSKTVLLFVTHLILFIMFLYLVIMLNIDKKEHLFFILSAGAITMLGISVYVSEKSHSYISKRLERILPNTYSFRKQLSRKFEVLLKNFENFDQNLKDTFGSNEVKVIPPHFPVLRGVSSFDAEGLFQKKDSLVIDDLKSNSNLKLAMERENIYAILPLQIFNMDKVMIVGFLILDSSMRNKIYMKEDFELLKMMTYTLATVWYLHRLFQKYINELKEENEKLRQSIKDEYRKSNKIVSEFNGVIENYERMINDEKKQKEILQIELRNNIVREILRTNELLKRCRELSEKLQDYENEMKEKIMKKPPIEKTGLVQVFAIEHGKREMIDQQEFSSIEELENSDFFHFYLPDLNSDSIEIIYIDPEGNKHKIT